MLAAVEHLCLDVDESAVNEDVVLSASSRSAQAPKALRNPDNPASNWRAGSDDDEVARVTSNKNSITLTEKIETVHEINHTLVAKQILLLQYFHTIMYIRIL